jgi:hypothetical protein
MPQSPPRFTRAACVVACCAPLAVGAALRLWNLPAQILAGDEGHALQAAVTMPLAEILTTYQYTDNCIPLSALFRLLFLAGVPLDEIALRLPIVVSGLLALAAIPLAAARRVGARAAYALAWLIALSPLLVLYSRLVRSYMPIVLLSFCAAAAFEAWWRTGRPRWAAVYVTAASASAFFHLASAPFVVAPLAYAGGELLVARLHRRSPPVAGPRSERAPGFRALAAVAVAVAVAFLSFLVPGRASLLPLIAEKHAPFEVTGREVFEVMKMQAGTGSTPVAAAFWLVAAGGLALLFRRDRRLAAYTVTLVAGQAIGLLVLSPDLLGHPLVFDRYLLPTCPWILLWAAVGLTAEWRGVRRRPALRAGVATLLVLGLGAAGPFAEPGFLTSSFLGHNDFFAFFCPRAYLAPAAVPAFYRRLRQERNAPILEFPFHPQWTYHHAYYAYQDLHRQQVLVGVMDGDPEWRLPLRNSIRADPRNFLGSRARYLAVHTDVLSEEGRVTSHCWPLLRTIAPRDQRRLIRSGRRMAEWLEEDWGKPDLREGTIEVWDLSRVRAQLALPTKDKPRIRSTSYSTRCMLTAQVQVGRCCSSSVPNSSASPARTSDSLDGPSAPARSPSRFRSTVRIWETLTTLGRGSPASPPRSRTFPGMAPSRRLEVTATTTVVEIALRLKRSCWTTTAGRRPAGAEPSGAPKCNQYTSPWRITSPHRSNRSRSRPARSLFELVPELIRDPQRARSDVLSRRRHGGREQLPGARA